MKKCCEKQCEICGFCPDHLIGSRLATEAGRKYWETQNEGHRKFHERDHCFGTGLINIKTGELRNG